MHYLCYSFQQQAGVATSARSLGFLQGVLTTPAYSSSINIREVHITQCKHVPDIPCLFEVGQTAQYVQYFDTFQWILHGVSEGSKSKVLRLYSRLHVLLIDLEIQT